MTPRWLLSLSGRKVQTAESRVPRRNPGAPMGMASGDSEATETSNPHGGEYETTLTPMLSGAWVILPAATSDWFAIRTLSREPKIEGIREMSSLRRHVGDRIWLTAS